jgi:cell cycle arrest protein BUB3
VCASYETDHQSLRNFTFLCSISFDHPVWACEWTQDGACIVSGGTDGSVRRISPSAPDRLQTMGVHAGPVRAVKRLDQQHMASASLDRTLRVWDVRSPREVISLPLPERPVDMSVPVPGVVVCALYPAASPSDNRSIIVYDVRSQRPVQQTKSMCVSSTVYPKSLACTPDYAVCGLGSGSITVTAIGPAASSLQSTEYTFHAHRTQTEAFPVNSLFVHPSTHVLMSGGGNGTYSLWDFKKRRSIRTSIVHPQPITYMAVNGDASIVVGAFGYDWSRGCDASSASEAPTSSLFGFVARGVREGRRDVVSDFAPWA